MNRIKQALFFGLLICASGWATAEVWPHQQTWNEAWEDQYSQWVQKDLSTQWLKKSSHPFSHWSVDCAKFIYLQRLYFCYQHGLEFAIRGNSPSEHISSRSSNWDPISQPELRLQAFAKYILTHVDTLSLQRDSVLVPATAQFIRPGVFLAADHQRAHTWLLKELRPSGQPILLFATLPGTEFLYESYVFPAPETAFPLGKVPTPQAGGFRRFLWPQDLKKKLSTISYASSEQSHLPYLDFFSEIQKRIQVQPANVSEEFSYLLEDLCMKFRVRVNIIIDSAHALAKAQAANKDGKLKAEDYDLYSTFARDRDIQITLQKVDGFFNAQRAALDYEQVRQYQSLLQPQWQAQDFCWVGWADNRSEPAGYLRAKFMAGKVSSDPYSSFNDRWGEPSTSSR